MRTLLWVLVGLNIVALLYFMALKLEQYQRRSFELRAQPQDTQGRLLKRLNKHLNELKTLQTIDTVGLLLTLAGFLVYVEQSLVGVIYALIITTALWALSRIKLIQQAASFVFEQHYEFVCQVAARLKPVFNLLGLTQTVAVINSKAELLDIVQTAPTAALSPPQRQRLELVLQAEDKTVKSIMTPSKRIVLVEPTATLGPIVLSDLQKSGHGYFPVATKQGEPEGILDLSDLANLQLAKRHSVVRDVMSTHLAWVEEDASLFELAETFLQEKQYLLLVRNLEGEFSGIVTIADLMQHLLGVVKE